MPLLRVIERFLLKNDIKPARFGRDAVGDPRFVFDLRRGREPNSKTTDRVLKFIESPKEQKVNI
jgi:hypothetical protein